MQPSLAHLHVGDNIEYEFVANKGKVQLWCGIVVSIDPDTERRAGLESKQADTTTKGASRLSTTNPDTERHVTESLFEGLRSNKRQKHLGSLPLPSARPLPKQKCGKSHATLASSALLNTYCTSVLLNSVSLYNFPDAGGNILFVSEKEAGCDTEIGKSA